MDVIANDLAKFEQDITDYDGSFTRLDRAQLQLLAHMNELQNMWEGEAHDQFMETFSKDYQKVVNMVDFLKEVLPDLNFADKEYTSCESSVESIIESMDV